MVRWTVILDRAARGRVKPDHLELGSVVHDPTHGDMLTFRDRFVAMKVAAQLGVRAVERDLVDPGHAGAVTVAAQG